MTNTEKLAELAAMETPSEAISRLDKELEKCQEFRGFIEMMRRESRENPKP